MQNGQVPAGALSKAIFETLLERKIVDGDKVKVIATSAPIPNYPMVMQGNLAPQLKDAIREAFLELKDADILKSFRVQGFAATDDKAYDVLREAAKSSISTCRNCADDYDRRSSRRDSRRRAACRRAGRRPGGDRVVCVAALWATGFFDAQRLIEGGPALAQLFREMVPPDFGAGTLA